MILILVGLGALIFLAFIFYLAWKSTKDLDIKCPTCGNVFMLPLGETFSCPKCFRGCFTEEFKKGK